MFLEATIIVIGIVVSQLTFAENKLEINLLIFYIIQFKNHLNV